MNIRVILSPDAKVDISSAIEWYHRADPNLAFRFEQETLTTLRNIEQLPFRFRMINGVVRRAPLKRFPYGIYYSLDHDEAFITAILHDRRSDDIWRQRSHGHS